MLSEKLMNEFFSFLGRLEVYFLRICRVLLGAVSIVLSRAIRAIHAVHTVRAIYVNGAIGAIREHPIGLPIAGMML